MQMFQIKNLDNTITNVSVKLSKYTNGRTRIDLIEESEDGVYPYATCTVNMPNVLLQPDEVLIKDYSENQGILEFLTSNNIVEETENGINTQHTFIPVCRLLPESKWGSQKVKVNMDNLPKNQLFVIKDYRVWAKDEEEAQKLVTFIEKI